MASPNIVQRFVSGLKVRSFFLLLILYGIGSANYFFPVLRTPSPLLNYFIVLFILMIPLVLIILAVSVKRLWLKIPLIMGLVPLLLVSLVAAIFTALITAGILIEGTDYTFEPVDSVTIEDSRVVLYRTDTGAMSSFGLIGRHEKNLLPGILLVRQVYQESPGYDAELSVIGPDTIKIVYIPYKSDRRKAFEKVIKLKRWVYL